MLACGVGYRVGHALDNLWFRVSLEGSPAVACISACKGLKFELLVGYHFSGEVVGSRLGD